MSVATDHIGLVECDPVFYPVAEGGETHAGVVYEVRDYGPREEAPVTILQGLREVPVI